MNSKIQIVKAACTMLLFFGSITGMFAQTTVTQEEMQKVYDEVKTPYKYGLVVTPPSPDKMADSPGIFRKGNKWYMYYIIFDGRGYETWMAESENLLHWETKGKVMSFSGPTDWDSNLGFNWNKETSNKAWDTFACSYDLVNWTDWQGEPLIKPSEEFDALYAHKPCVVKHKGIVYHFYCAVDKNNCRGIAVATSKEVGKSSLRFDTTEKRK